MTADLHVFVDVVDGRAAATLVGGDEWKRRFVTGDEAERRELVGALQRAVRRELDELGHLLLFSGDPDVTCGVREVGSCILTSGDGHVRRAGHDRQP
ncbi:hypothetical protein [Amycolatopsis sp. NBC_01480]|uniref:hypothetical protein n=1 Tax=Amycolatopsis sp. NBC_01480 TaxID=2903562 RepID=UPI002E296A81|nr:hypothetical protein [Amycolatopsis sp. NBC_01480]